MSIPRGVLLLVLAPIALLVTSCAHNAPPAEVPPAGDPAAPSPPPPASAGGNGYSCFAYDNGLRQRDVVCVPTRDCASRLGGFDQLKQAGLVSNFTRCVPMSSVWCFPSRLTGDTCFPLPRENCQKRRAQSFETEKTPERPDNECVERGVEKARDEAPAAAR